MTLLLIQIIIFISCFLVICRGAGTKCGNILGESGLLFHLSIYILKGF